MEEEEIAENINILNLPDEVLIKVIQFLPYDHNLSLSCKRFYDLVCDASRNSIPLDIGHEELCDESIYNSIIKSKRQFNDLTINLKNCSVLVNKTFDKLMKILEHYGLDLVKFKIWNEIQSKPTEMNDDQLYKLLSLLPNIQEFVFRNIVVTAQIDKDDYNELNLHKLRILTLDYCMINSSHVFNKIPQNVITDLVFTFEPNEEGLFQEFFDRQSNIKKLELYENEKLKFDHLQLEHLKISSDINYPLMIQQQSKLQYLDFAIAWVSDECFEEVCKLKNLKVLKTLIDLVSSRAFRNIQELTTLKELRLDSHSSYDLGYLEELSMMRGIKLEKLTLLFSERKIHSETIIQLANNFHYIKHVELINRSIAILDTFMQSFSNLETILLDYFAVFGAPEDNLLTNFNNETKYPSLKQLVVTNVNVNEEENGRNLLKLVDLCPNLERLMLSKLVKFSNDNLRNILELHPKMSHLSLEIDNMEFNEETIHIITEYGKKLKHFRLNGISSTMKYKILKEIFSEKFQVLNMYKYSSGEIELIMRKRNIEDWHLNFKLMNHF